MATGPKKRSSARGTTAAARGRKAAKTTTPRQGRTAGSAKTPVRKAVRTQAPARARTRQAAASGRGRGKTADLAAQLERISRDLEEIRGLRGEMQDLRARFDALSQQIETLLGSRDRSAAGHAAPPHAADESLEEARSQAYSDVTTDEEDAVEPTSALD